MFSQTWDGEKTFQNQVIHRNQNALLDQPFLWARFCKLKFWNFEKKYFGGFQLLEVTGKTSKNHQISICDFECIAKDIKGWLKFSTSSLVYSQISLNLLKEDCHFSTFSCGWCHFGYKHTFFIKTYCIIRFLPNLNKGAMKCMWWHKQLFVIVSVV